MSDELLWEQFHAETHHQAQRRARPRRVGEPRLRETMTCVWLALVAAAIRQTPALAGSEAAIAASDDRRSEDQEVQKRNKNSGPIAVSAGGTSEFPGVRDGIAL
ncbi:MAG TPA: hypothetical protein VF334_09510 [Polyangia bacterium]